MKKLTIFAATIAMAGMVSAAAWAGQGNGAPNGFHYSVNIIGVPKAEQTDFLGGNADSSGGSALFIPLVTSKAPKNSERRNGELYCTDLQDGAQTVFEDEEGPTWLYEEPDGRTRIYFDPNTDGDFAITDRDAVDGEGRISIPVDENGWVLVDLWVRVLGKPGGCAEISGYAYEDADNGGQNLVDLWWYSGSILVNRKKGRSAFVDATDIFEVDYCIVDLLDEDLDGITDECVEGTEESLSVFDDIFAEYFWEVNNNNTRLIQMRLYPR